MSTPQWMLKIAVCCTPPPLPAENGEVQTNSVNSRWWMSISQAINNNIYNTHRGICLGHIVCMNDKLRGRKQCLSISVLFLNDTSHHTFYNLVTDNNTALIATHNSVWPLCFISAVDGISLSRVADLRRCTLWRYAYIHVVGEGAHSTRHPVWTRKRKCWLQFVISVNIFW